MSVSQPKTVESLLYEGTQLYEKKNIFDALARWREILTLDPENSTAQHYIEFVQGHFNLTSESTRVATQRAQDQYSRLLRGERPQVAAEPQGLRPPMGGAWPPTTRLPDFSGPSPSSCDKIVPVVL